MSDRFQTRDPALPIILLDMGRLSIMLSCIDAPHLKESGSLRDFIGDLHAATGGNQAVLPLLIDRFDQWPGFGSKKQDAELTTLWTAFDGKAPESDAAMKLKSYCSTQPWPLPETMVHALFDDPSFDAIAYLDWHNS
ncbi:hypothetical protein [Bradyrhizobium sp. AUGA SZCCT0182]|uniref:hypothetical protein n=1 Tax=Bradyrhizobium sp. AUGA SZCCT0182 TaxID=2807667 RepID=UPI001BA93BD3|nr:hypothetical protein [Bradyrhizobium sp. AUGA SZCCT0182]MBR1236538.1 hypothetical protein [Bradyrhizobium sp. AUGA SZCCT0182]